MPEFVCFLITAAFVLVATGARRNKLAPVVAGLAVCAAALILGVLSTIIDAIKFLL